MRDNDWAVLLLVGVAVLILYMQPKQARASASGICKAYGDGAAVVHQTISEGYSPRGSLEALAQVLQDTAPLNSNTLAILRGAQERVAQDSSIDKDAPAEMVQDVFFQDCIKLVYILEMDRVGK
ncbi:exodeoxyribonuclease V subunit beta [Bacteriophage Phi NF-1]|uniref:Exodeoxyribonuclease V subunit beta n=1 Tax=Bacteriophage Phi NF-1 TaxID=2900273 RepID=A0A976QY01_9CAUD|nr:exodeoxyribonuclease V subunit beta [Bacteriophage Phi NF-1]